MATLARSKCYSTLGLIPMPSPCLLCCTERAVRAIWKWCSFWSTPSLLMSMRFANVACRRCKKPLRLATSMLSSF